MHGAANFNILAGMLSNPVALFVVRPFNSLNTSPEGMVSKHNLSVVDLALKRYISEMFI